jgi:hypothetical protein
VELEFWPDYGGHILFGQGRWVDPAELDLHEQTRAELSGWLAEYDDDKLPFGEDPDHVWLQHGQDLLRRIRQEAGARHTIMPSEDWWEPGADMQR